ncbi:MULTISPECIES: flavodoxin-dependent (E)-4-hydroxy-3-methylbut-2-enyl-diphosphate synthase [unclassified Pseudodesulfovibrio]|uniref:flavodoxin-dependent (E)-4-hydroxy-3-methylbut-2-enyl-diphosphate synthase n=1 Tax=unclassified Pseudodesulfovibrio TaxID=2661612 RepID=UPI000FEC1ED3|nr:MULTISPECIES: flavodoxin-dependent (E)-4-hydroxy-3-methylbut-2-enyl-diphosphate synthase [unclassified Pseudodesulfovibrio]MCJ2164480.1 flavodoxin-dependent (E)-4-hydroxy-3-methylbut-2-enyl-diphosphate synthase [Pseudodesulfovibrio sp. S3-i]RWU04680.1 flavodoxin-dependent (E)-4-hydroxy-3-methylbut-2-enyl-diphosphate synthase [Pseudodesulfovibrio sp. S3]
MQRKQTRSMSIGGVGIGGDNPVRVQSMCNTDTRDVLATVTQINQLAEAGCEIVRLAVPDEAAAAKLAAIREQSPVPLIADIHFDHRLALAALEAGFDGLRINPGNIGDENKVDIVVKAALAHGTPIRIGVNGGSLEKDLLRHHGGPTPEAMVESGLRHVAMLEKRGFNDIKISLKTSSVLKTVEAYRIMSEKVDYPLHIGITEAGTLVRGAVKSAVGLGILLHDGIGDTLRVSLTHDPVAEIGVAYEILRSLGLRERGPEIISCPTCGRTEIGLIELAEQVEAALRGVEEVFTVAVMGCVVNGPGEAREADIGIAGGRDLGIIFKKGEIVRKVRGSDNLLPEFMKEIDKFLEERRSE